MRETRSASPSGSMALQPWRGRALFLALVAALVGCGGEESPSQPLRLEVGTGREFTPLMDGETLQVQRGCQGGQHVFVSLRAWNLSPLLARVELTLMRTEDEQVVSLPYGVRLSFLEGNNPDAPAELSGLLLVVPEPAETLGKTVRLMATIESGAGQKASDARTGTLQLGPDACQ